MLAGPAGSGKTTAVLDSFRSALRRDPASVRLLTPTATMAEHFRHLLAREGFVFHPRVVTTLPGFVGDWAELPRIPGPVLFLAVERAIERLQLPAFARVAGMSGFSSSLVRLIEEFSSAGLTASALPADGPLQEAFRSVFQTVENDIARRGWALQRTRMEQAAERIRAGSPGPVKAIWLDGFFSFTDPELRVLEALARHAALTVTLPDYPGTAETRARLLRLGFEERTFEAKRPRPAPEVCRARTMDEEARHIARLILEEAAGGREFREMGILVRTPEEYLSLLRATLERYGIPARFYFDPPLAGHGTVRFLSGVVDALLGGWDWEATAAAVRMSGVESDHFDFAVRERLPGRGLEALREAAGGNRRLLELLDGFAAVDAWRSLRLTPEEWQARLSALCGLVRPPRPYESADHRAALLWRSQAAALGQFTAALGEAAQGCDGEKAGLEEFWRRVRTVLALKPLPVADHRRNVVHVLSVYEARQWELPVVFVCGMVEKQFPRYYSQDPIFPDASRRRLREAGFRVRTAAEREQEEKLLFELASTRSTARLVLTYPATDQRGNQTLRSLFLEGLPAEQVVQAESAALIPLREPVTDIRSPGLIAALAARHSTAQPSALESFLQCPFQFFGRHTLRLDTAPPRPPDRLDALAQGSIIHSVLSRWHAGQQPIETLFASVFESFCRKEAIPEGYRTEALRIQMLDDLRRFLSDPRSRGAATRTETPFEWRLDDGLTIRGRIDRMDTAGDGRVVVIDYKYSSSNRVRERVREGRVLQAPLYVLACERVLGLEVAGVFYVGLKKDVRCAGWGEGLGEVGEALTSEWLEAGLSAAREAIAAIRAGRTTPEPADPELCAYCELQDVCRYE